MLFDKHNGNTKWADATMTEINQLLEYNTFIDRGRNSPPEGYKQIRCHFIYDVKHDGCHKAHFVAGGHLTDVSLESVYSGAVSLRS